MAEITRRRTGELLRKLFEILSKEPEGLPARKALERLANSVTLTEYESGVYEGGGRRFEKIVRFATVDCVKAGWLQKNKGTWSITADGEKAYQDLPDPEAFYKKARVFIGSGAQAENQHRRSSRVQPRVVKRPRSKNQSA